MNGLASPPSIHLPGHIAAHLRGLVAAHPAIVAVWLFGSRANGKANQDSDWDFLAFGDRAVLNALRLDRTSFRPKIDLFIVYDGNRFENPWPKNGEPKLGRLRNGFDSENELYVYGYHWSERSHAEATYISTRDEEFGDKLRACRVFPP